MRKFDWFSKSNFPKNVLSVSWNDRQSVRKQTMGAIGRRRLIGISVPLSKSSPFFSKKSTQSLGWNISLQFVSQAATKGLPFSTTIPEQHKWTKCIMKDFPRGSTILSFVSEAWLADRHAVTSRTWDQLHSSQPTWSMTSNCLSSPFMAYTVITPVRRNPLRAGLDCSIVCLSTYS